MKRNLVTLANILLFVLVSSEILAQTISYPSNSFSSPAGSNNYIFPAGTNIGTLSPTGTAASAFTFAAGTTVATGLAHPWGLGIDPSGYVYIANYGSTSHIPGAVSKFNPANNQTTTFADGATDPNIANPQGIAFDQSGNAYILNYNRTNNGHGNYFGNANVNQYTSGGTYASTLISGLGAASGITNDLSNNLYIANAGNTTASEYNSSGVMAFSVNGVTLPNPVGVAVDNSGNIYVVDNTNKSVYKFSSTGAYISTPVTGLTNPFGLVIDASGNMYVGDSGADAVFDTPATTAGAVKIFSSSGTSLGNLPGSYLDPRGLVIDKTGNLYVSDFANNTLTQYLATGGYHLDKILPPGLSFDSTTGTFSGTPTGYFPTTTYKISAYNAGVLYQTSITITCTATLLISYSPNINVFTINTDIASQTPPVLTISGNSGTSSFIISPALPAGLSINGSTGAITGIPTAVSAAQIYTVTCTNGPNTATTTLSIACVQDDYWTGKNSTDWYDTKNWSTGAVPAGPTVQASIGVQSYTGKKLEPTVTANATVYYLELGATHKPTITVNSGVALTINSTLTIDNNAAPTVTGPGSINMASTAYVDVQGSGVLTITSPLSFTLQSDANGSAAVGTITTGGIIGNVTVQRFLPAGTRGYRLLSSPVNTGTPDANGNKIYSINYLLASVYTSGTGASFNTTTAKYGNPSMYLFRSDMTPQYSTFLNSCYRGVADMSASPKYTLNLEPGTYTIPIGNGYLFYFRGGISTTTAAVAYTAGSTPGSATLAATGNLNQGSVTFTHWKTGTQGLLYSTVSGDPSIEGFNVLGNPYASTIDLMSYISGGISMNNVSTFVYEYDPVYKVYGAYDISGNVPVGTSRASRYIASGQGFVVLAKGASSSWTFNESCKIASVQISTANLLLSKAPVAKIVPRYLRLQMALDSMSLDETIISFNNSAKTSYSPNEDAIYRAGSGKVSIASLSSDNKTIAINTMPLDAQSVSVRIRVGATANGTYSLNMNSMQGIPELYDIWLMDAYRKDSVDLRHNKSFRFDVVLADTNSYGAHRFTLVLRQNPAFAYHLLNFAANKATGRQVQVNWVTENEANYTNFTVERSTDGGTTYTVVGGVPSTGAGQYGLLDRNPGENNLYRLKQQDINNNITYSHIIPIGFANQANNLANSNINIYPNPAKSTVNMIIKTAVNDKAAIYNFTITNNYGLVIKQGTSAQTNWQTDISSLAPGTYIIQVINNTDKTLVGKSKLVKL